MSQTTIGYASTGNAEEKQHVENTETVNSLATKNQVKEQAAKESQQSAAPNGENVPNPPQNVTARHYTTLQALQHLLLNLYKLPQKPSSALPSHIQSHQDINGLKASILSTAKQIFILQRSVDELSSKLALVIRNHVGFSLDDKRRSAIVSQRVSDTASLTNTITTQIEFYSKLLYLFKHHTHLLSHMIPQITNRQQIDNLLQTVIFSLFADQFSEHEENLLLDLFEKILRREFARCQHIGSFMRSNTGFTKMLGAMMKRRTYQEYLIQVLQERVDSVLQQPDLNLELNPSRIFEELRAQVVAEVQARGEDASQVPKFINQEEALNYETVTREMQHRFAVLRQVVSQMLESILNSVERAPYGVRYMCKKIYEYGQERFAVSSAPDAPPATEEDILSLVGGFVILRFLNPPIAVLDLDTLGLKQKYADGLKPNQRTNMKYISKIIQNLSNGVVFGPKEPHLLPMNSFIETNRQRVLQFFRELGHVGSLSDRLEMIRFHELCSDVQTVQVSHSELAFMHQMAVDYLKGNSDTNSADAQAFDGQLHERTLHDAQLLRELLNDYQANIAPEQTKTTENDQQFTIELLNPIGDLSPESEVEALEQEHRYFETICHIIARLPRLPEAVDNLPLCITDVLLAGKKHAIESDDLLFANAIKESIEAYEHLAHHKHIPEGPERRMQESNAILEDLARYVNLQLEEQEFSKEKLRQLRSYLQEIEVRLKALEGQKSTYEDYMQNVLQMSYMPVTRVGVNEMHAGVARIVGPFKYTIQELVKMGIISETKIPQHFHNMVKAKIISDAPGQFLVTAQLRKVPSLVARGMNKIQVRLNLAELLQQQEKGKTTYMPPDLDDGTIVLNIPLLLNLLNELFVSRAVSEKQSRVVKIRKRKGAVSAGVGIDLTGMGNKVSASRSSSRK